VEIINVTIDKTNERTTEKRSKDSEEKNEEEGIKEEEEHPEAKKEEDEHNIPPKTPSRRVQKNHPPEQIIGNKDVGVETRRRIHSPEQRHLTLLSVFEPRSFEEANNYEHWVKAMDE
jgi:hypothetical protein